MEKSHLFVLPKDSHTGLSFLSTQYTLRACNRDYRNECGAYTETGLSPEFDCNKVPGKIAPLRSFDNIQGHWIDGSTRVFPPEEYLDLKSFITALHTALEKSSRNSRLWDLDGTVLITKRGLNTHTNKYTKDFVYVSKIQHLDAYNPISVHSAQAYVESCDKRGRENSLYTFPGQSTIVTGPHGGLHDNQALEMGFEEDEDTKDLEKRTYNPDHVGFICAGHTDHSGNAGKSRRITSYTRVRIPSRNTLDLFVDIADSVVGGGDWIVYCMGFTFRTNIDGIWSMVYRMSDYSKTYFHNQFVDYTAPPMVCPPTYMIYEHYRILYISISPGVLIRSLPDDSMIDWSMMYQQKQNSIIEHPLIPLNGFESIKYKYSTFFMMTPFGDHDRPPRTLFASGQTTQGIFFPWSPATARVSPLHASRPIVATRFVRDVEHDQSINPEAIWDIFPGEDIVVCYMNTILNYDDSMIISSKFADMGAFSTVSICTYRISESELIAEVGEKLCGKKYKWWKMDCTNSCICKSKSGSKQICTSGRVPSAKVHEVIRTEDGHISIKVLSFSQILTGDKVSTMHGQKGVVRIVPQEDLPIIVMEDESSFTADIYIAVGSIISRQTSGQIYESASGWRGARDGILQTVDDVIDPSSDHCDYIVNPRNGTIVMRQMPSGTVEPIRATVGITRVINQTQMTREKHHLTHRPEGKYSTGTRSGRADGGGVALSEMDFHAMYSSGLYGCAEELHNRGNASLIPICKVCHAIAPLHDCGLDSEMAMVSMPFDLCVYDQISAAVNGSCNRYTIEHI